MQRPNKFWNKWRVGDYIKQNNMIDFNNIPKSGTFGGVVDVINQNFSLAQQAIESTKYQATNCLGSFSTLADLSAAYDSPQDGDWAFVGTSSPYTMYVAKNGQWTNTGSTFNLDVLVQDSRLEALEDNDSIQDDRLDDLETFASSTQPTKDAQQDAAIEQNSDDIADIKDDISSIQDLLATKADESEMSTKNNQQDERLDTLEQAGLIYSYEQVDADYTLNGYGIRNATTDAYEGGANFKLCGYNVTAGQHCRVVAPASRADSSWARVYAFYNINELTPSTVVSSNYVPYQDKPARQWKTTDVDDEIIVPSGATMLVVTFILSLESSTKVYSGASIGAVQLYPRVAALEQSSESLDTRLEANETLDAEQDDRLDALEDNDTSFATQLESISAENAVQDGRLATLESVGLMDSEQVITSNYDHSLDGYAIINSTTGKYSAYESDYFTLLGYNVEEGEILEIKLERNSGQAGYARVYAFYALTSLDSDGTPLISAKTRIDAGESDKTWNGTACDDVVTVPANATMLVVTRLNSQSDKLEIKNLTPQGATSLFPRVDALEQATHIVGDATPTQLLEHWFITSQTNASNEPPYVKKDLIKWQTGSSHYFDAKVYAVNAGEQWFVSNIQNGATSSLLWAVYSGDTFQVPTDSLVYSIHDRWLAGRESNTPANQLIEENITIPEGGKWLVVTKRIAGTTQTVQKAMDIAEYVESLDARVTTVEGLGTRVTALEAEQAANGDIGKLSVKREQNVDFVGVAFNRGDGYELCYRLGRCFTAGNNTMGFGGAGCRKVDRRNSDATGVYQWESASGALKVSTLELGSSTDIIGPISYVGYSGFIGGAHVLNYASSVSPKPTTPTTQTETWEVLADGIAVDAGMSVMCNEVKLTVVNKIRRPSDNVIVAVIVQGVTKNLVGTAQTYNDLIPFCTETQEITIQRDGTVKVHTTIEFENDSIGKTIQSYYGMQSTFRGDEIITIGGKYDKFTGYATVRKFQKTEYPRFDRFVETKLVGDEKWCQSAWLRPDIGAGDHRYLADNDDIFRIEKAGLKGKYYHCIVNENANMQITSGLAFEWEGIYQWFPNATQATEVIEMAAASNTYTREECDARYYTREQIDAMLRNNN